MKAGREDLLGINLKGKSNFQMLLHILNDLRDAIVKIVVSANPKKEFEDDLCNLKYFLERLNCYQGEKEFLEGYLTLADFSLF